MNDTFTPAMRPDFFGQLAATDPYQGRARRLFERGRVAMVNGNQADVLVGYDARNNALQLKGVPIGSGYVPRVGDWVAIQYEAGHSSAPWITGPSMAADDPSDSAGIGVFPVRESEPEDPAASAVYFDESRQTWRGWDGADWVDFSAKLHNNLPDLQGGATGEYYHLSATQYAALPGGAGSLQHNDLSGIQGGATGEYYHFQQFFHDALADWCVGDTGGHDWTGDYMEVGYAQRILLRAGTAAAPSLARGDYPDDGIFWPEDGALGISIGGAESARFGSAGIGIGAVPDPNFRLRIDGVYVQRITRSGHATFDWYKSDPGYGKGLGLHNGAAYSIFFPDTGNAAWFAAGAVGAPAIARQGYADDGIYWPGDGLLGFVTTGAERARVSNTQLATNKVVLWLDNYAGGWNTAQQIPTGNYATWLQGAYGEVGSSETLYLSNNWDFANGVRPWTIVTTGTAALRIRTRSAGGSIALMTNDADSAPLVRWYVDGPGSLLPGADNAYPIGSATLGALALYLSDANTTAPSAEGEIRAHGTQKAFEGYLGGQLQILSSLIYCRTADVTVYSSGGTLAEQDIDAFVIPAALLVAGNTFTVVVEGRALTVPRAGGSGILGIKLTLEGTDLVVLTDGVSAGPNSQFSLFRFEASITVRSTTQLEVTMPRLTYHAIEGGGIPWPATLVIPTIYAGGQAAPVIASGAATIAMRGSFSTVNTGDTSHIVVHKFNVAMEAA